MPDFAPPASKLSSTGVPLGPLPRPSEFPQEWPIGMVGMWPGTAATLPTNFRVLDGSTIGTVAQYDKLAARCPSLVSGANIVLPDMEDVYPKGGATAGDTGGANTNPHTHSGGSYAQAHTHITGPASGGGTSTHTGDTVAFVHRDENHFHTTTSQSTTAVTGTSGAASDENNEPSFRTFLFVIRVA